MVNTLPSNAGGAGSVPTQGPKIPHALWSRGQNRTEKNIVMNSIKTQNTMGYEVYQGSQSFFDLNFSPRIISMTSLIERSA